jgi:hypothetical protein
MGRKARIILAIVGLIAVGTALWHWTRPPELPIGPDGLRYDPIEDDPNVQPLIRAAEEEAMSAPELQGSRPRGWVHGYWDVKKRILKEKYGIDWRTPAELNRNVAFD